MAKYAEKINPKMLFVAFAAVILAVSCMFVFGTENAQGAKETATAVGEGEIVQSEATTYGELREEIATLAEGDTLVLNHDCVSNDASEDPIQIAISMTLDLNGYIINRNLSIPTQNGHAIIVGSSEENGMMIEVTIKDSKNNGKITGGNVGGELPLERNNCGGGLLVFNGAKLEIDGVKVCGNKAENRGGGIYCESEKEPVGGLAIINSTVCDNTAKFGGGICVRSIIDKEETGPYASLVLSNSVVIKNNAATDMGGGIYLQDAALLTIEEPSTICENKAGYSEANEIGGGGICLNGGGIIISNGSKITNNETDGLGGGIYVRYGGVLIQDAKISSNKANIGGGVALRETVEGESNPVITITSVEITYNHAEESDGAIYNPNEATENFSSVIILAVGGFGSGNDDDTPQFRCIIKENTVGNKLDNLNGEIYVMESAGTEYAPDCEIWVNDESEFVSLSGFNQEFFDHVHIDSRIGRIIVVEGELTIKENPQVRFDPNGGTMEECVQHTYDSLCFDKLPVPTRLGYTFAGWYSARDGGTEITTTTPFEDSPGIVATVYAHWNIDMNAAMIAGLVVIVVTCIGLFALNRVKK